MDSSRFILRHPVKAQQLTRQLCTPPNKLGFESTALVIVWETDDDIGSQHCAAFCTAFRSAFVSDTCVATVSDVTQSEVIFAAWTTDQADLLVAPVRAFWKELNQLAEVTTMFGAIGLKDYAAICTLRMNAPGGIAIDDGVFSQLDEELQGELLSLGYRQIDDASMNDAIWMAFLRKVQVDQPDPELQPA